MNQTINCAESVDTMNKRLAIGFLVVSLVYALDVLGYLINEPLKIYLNHTGNALAILSILIVVFAMWPIFSQQITKSQSKYHEAESFITDAMHSSIRISWMVTLFFLVLMMSLDNFREGLDLPTDFYFKLIFFVMMFTVGASFFFITRDDDDVESN